MNAYELGYEDGASEARDQAATERINEQSANDADGCLINAIGYEKARKLLCGKDEASDEEFTAACREYNRGLRHGWNAQVKLNLAD